jgi:hypothetical protein
MVIHGTDIADKHQQQKIASMCKAVVIECTGKPSRCLEGDNIESVLMSQRDIERVNRPQMIAHK